MNHIDLTPRLIEQKRNTMRSKFNTVTFSFLAICFLPLILYALYAFNVFSSISKPGEFADLEDATALVTTMTGTGTAFLVSDSKLLTARHVVESIGIGGNVSLLFEKAEPPLEVSATVEWMAATTAGEGDLEYFLTDVAVLKLDNPDAIAEMNLFALDLGDSDGLGNLTPVVAIGYPRGDYSIKRGDINSDKIDNEDLFKLDSATNPGDSGGPLVLEENRSVIGIMVGGRNGAQGENVAIKINNVLGLLGDGGIELN